jgi:hypothetical protein
VRVGAEAAAAEVEEEAGCGGGVGRGGERGKEEVEESEGWRWEGQEETLREVEVRGGKGDDAAEEDGSEVGEAAGSEEVGVELPYLVHGGGAGDESSQGSGHAMECSTPIC